jgi:hypothetical protein
LFGSAEPLFKPVNFLINTGAGGDFITNVNVLFLQKS